MRTHRPLPPHHVRSAAESLTQSSPTCTSHLYRGLSHPFLFHDLRDFATLRDSRWEVRILTWGARRVPEINLTFRGPFESPATLAKFTLRQHGSQNESLVICPPRMIIFVGGEGEGR